MSPFAFLLCLFAIFYVVCYLTVAAHEGAHAVAALGLKVPVYRIILGRGPVLLETEHCGLRMIPAGGEISLREDSPEGIVPLTSRQLAVISGAGPLANLVIAMLMGWGASYFVGGTLAWCALTFATLFNTLCFFQNIVPVADADGFLVWSYVSERYYHAPLSDWAIAVGVNAGKALFNFTMGCYMSWVVWTLGVLRPWLSH